jgi:hypothetical protein
VTQGIDVFIPGKEAALITANTEHFATLGTRVLTVADPVTLALLQDKGRFYQAVDHAIVAPPDFICINDSSGFRRAYTELRSRYAVLCIKPEAQEGSGHTPLPLELRSCVIGPTRTYRRVEIRTIGVCRREENLRSEVPSDLPGGITLPAGTMQAVFCRGQILR